MTEAEARSTAKTLRSALIGVTATPLEDDRWGVRRWSEEAIYPGIDKMPPSWQQVLSEATR